MTAISNCLRPPGLGDFALQNALTTACWPIGSLSAVTGVTPDPTWFADAMWRSSPVSASELPVVQEARDYRDLMARAARADRLEAAEATRRERNRANGRRKTHGTKEAILATAADIAAASKVRLRDTDIVRKIVKECGDLTSGVKPETIRRWLGEARK